MDDTIVEAIKVAGGFIVGAGTVAIAYVKGWWVAKTPEAQKRFLVVVGKALADGKISMEEYEKIMSEL